MLAIKRNILYSMMLLLSSIQVNIVRSDVQETLAAIETASVDDIAQALLGNQNALTKMLQTLKDNEQSEVIQTIQEQYSELFSGYMQSHRPLVPEDQIHFSKFRLQFIDDGVNHKSSDAKTYSLINNETGKEIYRSVGWCTHTFSQDESLVAHYVWSYRSAKIVVFNTNTYERKEIFQPEEKEHFYVGSCTFTADNRYLIITTPRIYVYDLQELRYCTADEDSLGGALLALNNFFSKIIKGDDDHEWVPRLRVTTSACGRYIAFSFATIINDNVETYLYIYHTENGQLRETYHVDYETGMNCCFSGNGDSLLAYYYKKNYFLITLFESATGTCFRNTKISEQEIDFKSLALNNDGTILVAKIKQAQSLVLEYKDLNVLEQDLTLDKALFVCMLSKWHTAEQVVDFTEYPELIALLKTFTPESQLLLQQKYNIILPKSYLKRLWNNVASCTIM